MFTYIHALLIDKDLSECWNVLINFPCALLFISFIWRSLHFLLWVFPLIPIFVFNNISFINYYIPKAASFVRLPWISEHFLIMAASSASLGLFEPSKASQNACKNKWQKFHMLKKNIINRKRKEKLTNKWGDLQMIVNTNTNIQKLEIFQWTQMPFLLIKKGICDRQNISSFCVYFLL